MSRFTLIQAFLTFTQIHCRSWALILCFTVTLHSSFAFAHQQKAAITRVLFNERTGNLEVMHRFNMHDAEHAVRQLFRKTHGKSADIIGDEQTQKNFADYVTQRFHVSTGTGETIALAYVGYEIEGQHFWVYQEAPIPSKIKALNMQHDALRDIWQQQSNQVNIEGKGKLQTLVFDGKRSKQRIEFKVQD